MKRRIAALTAALVTFPAVAFADPPESVTGHWRAAPARPLPTARDAASHLPALGTDVAASDQQASKPAPVAAGLVRRRRVRLGRRRCRRARRDRVGRVRDGGRRRPPPPPPHPARRRASSPGPARHGRRAAPGR